MVMTQGERMVWAAEFVRWFGPARDNDPLATAARASAAAFTATQLVKALRATLGITLEEDTRAMINEMISED